MPPAKRVMVPAAEEVQTAEEATADLAHIQIDGAVYDEDILASVPGFKPITAYNILQPNTTINYETADTLSDAERDDPTHRYRRDRPRITFRWGVFLCTKPIHVEVLKNKPGIYFENMPAGTPAPVCRKCRFSCRNETAMIRHMETHLD